jgi:hypothetical protein
MTQYTRRVQSRYETCNKRADGDVVVCEVEIVVQSVDTGYIEIKRDEIRVPSSLGFAEAVAYFEAERMALDQQEA